VARGPAGPGPARGARRGRARTETTTLPDGTTRVTRWGVATSGKASAYVGWAGPADVQLRRCVVRLAPSPRVDADVVDAIEVFARACERAVFTGTAR
jgi:hypothetical protein